MKWLLRNEATLSRKFMLLWEIQGVETQISRNFGKFDNFLNFSNFFQKIF